MHTVLIIRKHWKFHLHYERVGLSTWASTHKYIYAKSYHMSLYLQYVVAYFSQNWKYEKLESTANTFTYGERKYYTYTVHCTLSSEIRQYAIFLTLTAIQWP
jgi:hypothetical protein